MKKIIAIISILTLSFGVYAQNYLTSFNAEFVENYNKAENKISFISDNAEILEITWTELSELIANDTIKSGDIAILKNVHTKKILALYIDNFKDGIANLSFKEAVFLGFGFEYLSLNNVAYSELKSTEFVYQGITIDNYTKAKLATLSGDYSTLKEVATEEVGIFSMRGFRAYDVIQYELLNNMTTIDGYEESKFWENIYVQANQSGILSKIQNLQDVLYLRLMRDNKIK